MNPTKSCALCGAPFPKHSRYLNCEPCRGGPVTEHQRNWGAMDELAELRYLVDRWNAFARTQTPRGPARLWR